MGIGSFLQGVGQHTGRVYEWQQQNAARKLELEGKQQSLVANEIDMEAKRADMEAKKSLAEARAAIGKQIEAGFAADKQAVAEPKRQADIWGRAEEQFSLAGDNEGAIRAGKLRDGYLKEHADAGIAAAKALQEKQEALSMAALDFRSAPTTEKAAVMARAAVNAGVNPVDMPAPGSKGFNPWVDNMAQASMTGKERYATVERQKEFAVTDARLKDANRRADEDRDASRNLTAAIQSGAASARADAKSESRDRTSFYQTEKLNTTLQTVATPILLDRQMISLAKTALAAGGPVAHQQLRQMLPALSTQIKGRATDLYYRENTNFGGAVDKLFNVTSRFMTGTFDEKTQKEIYNTLDYMEKTLIDPELRKMEQEQKTKAGKYGLDPSTVQIQGNFSRVNPTVPKAPTAKPTPTVKHPADIQAILDAQKGNK